MTTKEMVMTDTGRRESSWYLEWWIREVWQQEEREDIPRDGLNTQTHKRGWIPVGIWQNSREMDYSINGIGTWKIEVGPFLNHFAKMISRQKKN
jgi:hypothetical protein